MTDPGFVVTIRDVYDKVTALGESLDTLSKNLGTQATEVALLKQRMDSAEEDISQGRKDREDDRRLRVNLKWQMIGVLVAALVSPVLSYLLMHH